MLAPVTSTHPILDPERIGRLRRALAGDGGDGSGQRGPDGPTPDAAPPAPRRGGGARGAAERLARRMAGPAARRAADVIAARVVERMAPGWEADRAAMQRAAVDLELLKAELASLEALVALGRRGALGGATAATSEQLRGLAVNLELLKGDQRALAHRLEEVGWAVAPGTGLEGVPERFAELRERVNALDRRVRALAAPPTVAPPGAPARAGPPAADRFDYVGFERRFRGDPAEVLRTLTSRYGDVLTANPPVLDVGCGRGELLAALAERGVPGRGVDSSPDMVGEARAAGLDVALDDAVHHLRSLPEASLGSIIAVHVVEHLDLEALTELLELAATRLRPGGVLVAETPNPASLVVLGNSYVLDPTHVWPLHPSLLTFLCERAGFRDVRLGFYSPADDYRLPRVEPPDDAGWAAPLNDAIDRLNLVLFGPQEYSVVATTPPAPTTG
jgi:SAM-dependent methyltransferase